jgi:hypothetical protein
MHGTINPKSPLLPVAKHYSNLSMTEIMKKKNVNIRQFFKGKTNTHEHKMWFQGILVISRYKM